MEKRYKRNGTVENILEEKTLNDSKHCEMALFFGSISIFIGVIWYIGPLHLYEIKNNKSNQPAKNSRPDGVHPCPAELMGGNASSAEWLQPNYTSR